MSLYAVVLLKVGRGGGGGGAKCSVNFVMGSWHPCITIFACFFSSS